MSGALFRTKSVQQILAEPEEEGHHLKRALKAPDLIALGIGAIIGAGIFASTGSAAAGGAEHPGAGPAIIVSYILVAIACGFCALCYAEFASLIPIAGSAYTYSYATLGELVAWIIGWDLILEYAVGNVAVAISWSGYFGTMVRGIGDMLGTGWSIPAWLLTPTMQKTPGGPEGFTFNLPAIIVVLFITALLIRGVKESAFFNNIVVVIKLLVIFFFIVMGLKFLDPANWRPFAPNGFHGIQAGAFLIFFAYIGFDAVSTAAEETENPGRNMPIGMIGSLIICTLLYIGVSAVLTGMVSYTELGTADPMATAFEKLAQQPGRSAFDLQLLKACSLVVSVGAVFSMTAVLLVFQMGQPRIFFTMARDGLLPPVFAAVHPRFRTPWVTTIATGLAVGVASAFLDISVVLELCNIGTLLAFVIVCGSILLLRFREGQGSEGTPYKTWAVVTVLFGLALLILPLVFWSDAQPHLSAFFANPGDRKLEEQVAPLIKSVLIAIFCGTGSILSGLAFMKTGQCNPRPFNTPAIPLVPWLGITTCFFLMLGSPWATWARLVAWLVAGLVLYFAYGYRNSRLNN